MFSLFANPRAAMAALSPDIEALRGDCGIDVQGAGKIPFICFDLAGGANMAGSNVLIGGQGGQLDFLSTAGYGKLGSARQHAAEHDQPGHARRQLHRTRELGLAFHSDSAFLRGMLTACSPATRSHRSTAP